MFVLTNQLIQSQCTVFSPQGFFGAYDDQGRATTQLTDFHFPDKRRYFLLLESGSFNFVSPDRLPVTIDSVDQCIDIANIIR